MAPPQDVGGGIADFEVTETHYVSGRLAEQHNLTPFERLMHAIGVVRHDVLLRPGQEKGADVELALQMLESAVTQSLDVAVLVSGDADLVPAVNRLTRRGVHVIIPRITVTWKNNGNNYGLITAWPLVEAASDAPGLEALLVDAMDDSGYQGAFPFSRKPATDNGPYGAKHTGRINRWREDEPYGFITDTHGQSWWMSKDSLLCSVTDVGVGTWVEFQGSPHRLPDKKVPTAYSVRLQHQGVTEGGARPR